MTNTYHKKRNPKMTDNDTRDIIHEIADVPQILGDDYTMTQIPCAPGGCAVKITKKGSARTLAIVFYHDPDEPLFFLFGGDGYCISYLDIFDRTFDDISGKYVNIIRESF